MPQVSGVSTDVVLFSEHGSLLVHHYRVVGRSAAHASLRGTFMTKLWVFTVWADAEANDSVTAVIRFTGSAILQYSTSAIG